MLNAADEMGMVVEDSDDLRITTAKLLKLGGVASAPEDSGVIFSMSALRGHAWS